MELNFQGGRVAVTFRRMMGLLELRPARVSAFKNPRLIVGRRDFERRWLFSYDAPQGDRHDAGSHGLLLAEAHGAGR